MLGLLFAALILIAVLLLAYYYFGRCHRGTQKGAICRAWNWLV